VKFLISVCLSAVFVIICLFALYFIIALLSGLSGAAVVTAGLAAIGCGSMWIGIVVFTFVLSLVIGICNFIIQRVSIRHQQANGDVLEG